jgi:hypothetical protein
VCESTEEGRGGFVSNFFSEEAPRVLEKEMVHPSCQLWCGYSLKAATATRSLVQAEAELDFPPAIPLELLMRARCALVLYSDSFSDRSLFRGGYLGFKSHTLPNQKKPPVLTHIRGLCSELPLEIQDQTPRDGGANSAIPRRGDLCAI